MLVLRFLYTVFYWAIIIARWALASFAVTYYMDVFLKLHRFTAVILPTLDHFLSVGYGFMTLLFINLFVREMGHGYCAMLLRLRVRRCIVGFPLPVSYVSFLWLPWQLSTAYPNLSLIQYGYVGRTALRLRIALMLLAGPFATTLVLAGCAATYFHLVGPNRQATIATPHIYFLAGAAAATLYVLVGNLVPLAFLRTASRIDRTCFKSSACCF